MPLKGFADSEGPGDQRKSRGNLSQRTRGLRKSRDGKKAAPPGSPAAPTEVRKSSPAPLPTEAPGSETLPTAPAEPPAAKDAETPIPKPPAKEAPASKTRREPGLRRSQRSGEAKTSRKKRGARDLAKKVAKAPATSLPAEPPLPVPAETPEQADRPETSPATKSDPAAKSKRSSRKKKRSKGDRPRDLVVRTTTPQGSSGPEPTSDLPADHPLTEAREALEKLKKAIASKGTAVDTGDPGEWDELAEDDAPAVASERVAAKAPVNPVGGFNQFRAPEPKLQRVSKPRESAKKTAHASPRSELIARAIRPTALFLFLMGWWLAVLFGHGFDLHRLYWPALFAGGGAVLLALTNRGRLSDFPWTGFFFLSIGAIYFLIRCWTSPVYDLARLDLPLICGFGLAVIVGATKPDWRFVAPTLAAVAMGHVAVGFYQEFVDGSFAVFRGERFDTKGVSGLYFHRNYLAGFLEVFLPFWGTMLVGRRDVKPWVFIINALVLALAGFLLILTASRGGLAAAGIGFLIAMFIVGAARWRTGGRKTRATLIAVGSTFTIVFIIAVVFLVRIVFEQRGKAGQLTEGLGDEGRLGMAGMAYEQWLQTPLFGAGSRSYSYASITNWDFSRLPGWLGSPTMAHNDYLQVLTDYGAVGLVLILGLAAWLTYFAIRRVFSSRIDRRRPGESWIPAAVVGAIAASAVHGVVDFSLHILPNVMLLGLVVGLLPGLMARKSHSLDLEGWARFKGPALTVLAGGLALTWVFSGWRELAALPAFLRLEEEVYSKESTDETRREAFREVFLRAPSYPVARDYGALELDRATEADSSDLDEEIGVAEATAALEVAAQHHPYDGIVALNYARALDLAERNDDAAAAYQRAIAILWRREDKYGAMLSFALHLARRGIEHLDAGEEEPALGFFQRAKTYLDESWRLNHRPDSFQVHKKDVDWLNERIVRLREKEVRPRPLPDISPPPSLGPR